MSDLQTIKKRIYEEEKIEELLERLGCYNVRPEGGRSRFSAHLPDKFESRNNRSVQVKNQEGLSSAIRSRGIFGDIFTVASYILFEDENKLFETKKWVCEKLGYQEYLNGFTPVEEKEDYLWFLKDIHKERKKQQRLEDVTENKTIDESVFDEYVMLPYDSWIKEGISYQTQIEFQIGFHLQSERVIFPIHNKNGELIGVKGRYIGKDEEVEDQFKYIYLQPCNKSIELFNLHRALPYIREQKEVIIVEAAKTTMLAWSNGVKNMVSIEGDYLTPQQIQLLKELGIEIDLVFAWDKDKNVNFIKKQVETLKGRKVYALYDTQNLFENKQSPFDKGLDTWEKLYSKKFQINIK